jgi:glycosyltransferase involved in cell wall biosynthesis
MPLVSVCMATYNGEKYIYEQTASILNQLSADDELVVSDDGSTDDTLAILKGLNDNRIKIFSNKGNKGPVGNFQNGLEQVTGDYIFLADQDDVWFPNKIEVMSGYLEKYDVVACDCTVVNDNLQTLEESFYRHRNSGAGFIKNLKGNTYMGNSMAFRKELLPVILPFPQNIPNHDLWIGVVADLFYKPYFIPQILGLHRRHNANASNTFDVKIKTSFWQKVNKRILVFRNLPRLFLRKLAPDILQ